VSLAIARPARSLAATATRRFRNLRLFPKLLVPFLILTLVIGVSGAFVLVRGLATRAQADLKGNVRRLLGDADSLYQIDLQYLQDSVFIAANLQGMAEAVAAGDGDRAAGLADSVRVLRVNLNLLVIADRQGRGLVELEEADIAKAVPHRGGTWSGIPFVARIFDAAASERAVEGGFLAIGGQEVLAVARAIRPAKDAPAVGVSISGIRLDAATQDAARRVGAGIRVFDGEQRLLATAGLAPRTPPAGTGSASRPLLARETARDGAVFSGYAPLTLEGVPIGILGVSAPVGGALASARDAAIRLAVTLALVMAALVAVGALLSRSILGQVRPLVSAHRALAAGELAARAPVLAGDELGELASGFNTMAEQLEESYRGLERKVAERTEELAVANRKLEETYRAQSEFFAQLSHELRTPLFLISGNAEMLHDLPDGAIRKADRKEMVVGIKQAGDYITGLVNEILDFKRLEAGRMPVQIREVDLGAILGELSTTARSLAQFAGLTFEVEIPPALPAVRADPAHLHKIVNNLVSNAVKYTPAGGNVRLSAAMGDGEVEVSVADTGVGIPRKVGDRIFEPFYRVKEVAPERGEASSGLGLALTKELVQAQGGRIWYRGAPRKGTVFAFTVPVASGRTARAGAPRTR
jgi:signal transduction histidine kinase